MNLKKKIFYPLSKIDMILDTILVYKATQFFCMFKIT